MGLLLRIADRAIGRPLLIHPDKVPLILAVLHGRIPLDVEVDREGLEARIAALPEEARAVLIGPLAPDASRFVGSSIDEDPNTGTKRGLPYKRKDGVAIVSVVGSLINRGAWIGSSSGEVSYEGIKTQIQAAAADPRAHAILLDIDSPGGEAVGCFECADVIRGIEKPVWAVVNGMAASAAYAIASAADRIITGPSGVVGSIGVVMVHADHSRELDKKGITPTLLFAGAHKVDGHPFGPLPDSVRADIQAEINQFYDLFVEGVAKGRTSMSPAAIRATEARCYIGQAAVDVGLADEVGSFETVLAELTRRISSGSFPAHATRRTSMATEKTYTQAEFDSAVTAARTEGATTALATARTEFEAAATAGAAKAKAEGVTEGRAAAVTDLKAVVSLEETKGREVQALALIGTGCLDVAAAKALLGTTPKSSSLEQRMAGAAGLGPDPGANPPPKAETVDWAAIAARTNQTMGLKVPVPA